MYLLFGSYSCRQAGRQVGRQAGRQAGRLSVFLSSSHTALYFPLFFTIPPPVFPSLNKHPLFSSVLKHSPPFSPLFPI
jgi:hypothetical protein